MRTQEKPKTDVEPAKATEPEAPVETIIPDDEEVREEAGGKAWRFANGQIVRGQEDPPRSGQYAEHREKLIGRLVRVGIFTGHNKDDGREYKQLEADLQTAHDGIVHVKSNLTSQDTGELQPSVATLKFAWGLTQIARHELFMMKCTQGEPIELPGGRKGGCPTYVNFSRIDEKNVARQIYSPKRDKSAPTLSAIQQWELLEPQIRAHPTYKDREETEDDSAGRASRSGPTHFSELARECKERAWPTPDEAPAEWLAMVAKGFAHAVRARLSDYTDDEWSEIRQIMNNLKTMPGALQPALERRGAAPAAKTTLNPDAFAPGADPFK